MIQGLLMAKGVPESVAIPVSRIADSVEAPVKAAVKRKVGKYQREFGRQLRALKRKHPRSQISTLMKRAHRLTKKVMK
jgi:hypothetical protein|tara:strand:+ start:182 stop:415 length:234 start_codon:yes stop_codon:yes gene_type:complete